MAEKADFATGGLSALLNDVLYYPVQFTFGQLGLTSPMHRGVAGLVLGYFFTTVFKPAISWDVKKHEDGSEPTGKAYLWSFSGRAQKLGLAPSDTTAFPWWAWPLLFGGAFGLFF